MDAYLSGVDAQGRPVVYRWSDDNTIAVVANPAGEQTSGRVIIYADRAEIVPEQRPLRAKWWMEVPDEPKG